MDPRLYPGGDAGIQPAVPGASFLIGAFRKSATVDLASVSANTAAEQDVTVTGVKVGDTILAEPPSGLNAGAGVVACRAKSANTVTLRISNNTGSSIDAASATWYFTILRFGN